MKFDNPKRLILALFMACMSVLFAEVLHGQNLDEDLLKALARPVEAKSATEEKAAEPTVSKFEPYRTGGGHLVEIGPYRVDNLWQGQERKAVVADDWRYFMHGMKDAASYPLAWDEFIDADQEKYTRLWNLVSNMDVPLIRLIKDGQKNEPYDHIRERYRKAIAESKENLLPSKNVWRRP